MYALTTFMCDHLCIHEYSAASLSSRHWLLWRIYIKHTIPLAMQQCGLGMIYLADQHRQATPSQGYLFVSSCHLGSGERTKRCTVPRAINTITTTWIYKCNLTAFLSSLNVWPWPAYIFTLCTTSNKILGLLVSSDVINKSPLWVFY